MRFSAFESIDCKACASPGAGGSFECVSRVKSPSNDSTSSSRMLNEGVW